MDKVRKFLNSKIELCFPLIHPKICESVWRTLVVDRDVTLGSSTAKRAGSKTIQPFRVLCSMEPVIESHRPGQAEPTDAIDFTMGLLRELQMALQHQRIFCSDGGHLCLGSDFTQPSDLICILFGAEVLFVLCKRSSHSILIGEAYVHGAMNGELMEKGLPIQTFDLR